MLMTKVECLNALDDLRVIAWEYRDLMLRVAQNESWDMVHDAPKGLVKVAVSMSLNTCDRFTERMNDIEEKIMLGLNTDFQDIVNEFTRYLADNVMRYNAMMNKLDEHATKFTHKARYRKSYIRS